VDDDLGQRTSLARQPGPEPLPELQVKAEGQQLAGTGRRARPAAGSLAGLARGSDNAFPVLLAQPATAWPAVNWPDTSRIALVFTRAKSR
jgi:hypothetical protein